MVDSKSSWTESMKSHFRRTSCGINAGKSLAPYRDCLGGKDTGAVICWGRGSFDRGDLKEAAGASVRAMEPQP
jgi:hypothetical protein